MGPLQTLSSSALADATGASFQVRAMASTAAESMLRQGVARCGARVRQHIDGVARASSAGTKSGSSARSLVLHTMLAPVLRTARFRDQLQLDDESNSQIADGSDPGTCRPRSLQARPTHPSDDWFHRLCRQPDV